MTPKKLIIGVVVAVLAVAGALLFALPDASPDRQAHVATRGAQVMPFDLDRTTHRFDKTAAGGEQTVISDNPADTAQIRLIQDHLTQETAKFGRGDFADPAAIHGHEMPGLATLSANHQRINTTYTPLPAGARITYTTDDPTVTAALHAWFDAQVSDHGPHAER